MEVDETDCSEASNTTNSRISDTSHEAGNSKRLKKLDDAIYKLLNTFCRPLRLTGPIKNADPEVIRNLHDQTVQQLRDNIKMDFEKLFTEENVQNSLNSLDELSEKYGKTEKQWYPSGDVSCDSRPHVASLLQVKKEALEKNLHDLEAHNKLLQDAVRKKEERLIQTRTKILNHAADLQMFVQSEIPLRQEVEGTLVELQRDLGTEV